MEGQRLDEKRLRLLLEVGTSLVAELDSEAVLRRVLEAGRELTGARYAAVGILDPERRELERFLTTGIDGRPVERSESSRGATASSAS